MHSDYVDNWDSLPEPVQSVLEPLILQFDQAADQLFDRRLNLSFEAAVKELSIPGIAALTQALRGLPPLLKTHVTVQDAAEGRLLFDDSFPLTAYDLPLYTPCVYLSQLAQAMDTENVRVWKESTAAEIVHILLFCSQYIRPDIEIARVMVAALHDMAYLYPATIGILEEAQPTAQGAFAAETALRLVRKRT